MHRIGLTYSISRTKRAIVRRVGLFELRVVCDMLALSNSAISRIGTLLRFKQIDINHS
jgi:hypothetical protein